MSCGVGEVKEGLKNEALQTGDVGERTEELENEL